MATPARIILDKYIHSGDFDVSVRQSYQHVPNDSFSYDWEVKAANFKSVTGSGTTTDQNNIDSIENGGLVYITRFPGLDDENSSTLGWRYKSGSTEESGSIGWTAISNPSLSSPYKLGIRRRGNVMVGVVNDIEVSATRSENASWGNITNIRGSFAQEKNASLNSAAGTSGFNSFFVSGGDTPNDCLGADGQGSSSVSSPYRISSILRFREIVGPEESHTVRHQETHSYFRPLSESDGFHDAFKVDIKSYADGSESAVETITNISHRGDIQNRKKVEGNRIQNELNMNMGHWKLVGVDSHLVAEDKKSVDTDPGGPDQNTYEELLAGTSGTTNYLTHWLTRPDGDLNRATGTNYTLTKPSAGGTATPSFTTGPDGEEYGLVFGDIKYAQADLNQYTDFSILIWVKDEDDAGTGRINIEGGNDLDIIFLNSTTIRLTGDVSGNVDLSIDDMGAGWNSFMFKKTGLTISVYQNGGLTAKDSGIIGADYGNSQVLLQNIDEGPPTEMEFYDFRLYSDDIITPAAFEYYHDKMVNDSGTLILPIV